MSVNAAASASTQAKASSLGITASSGGISLGFATVSEATIILSIVALVISTFAFLYDHYHTHEDERESGMVMWTTFAMYIIFGTPALPAGYNYSFPYTEDPTASMVAGFLCSWIVVAVVKAIKLRTVKEIHERKI